MPIAGALSGVKWVDRVELPGVRSVGEHVKGAAERRIGSVDCGQIQRPGQRRGRPERRRMGGCPERSRMGRTVDRDPPELAGGAPAHLDRHAAARKVGEPTGHPLFKAAVLPSKCCID